jgi:hypothetical protein
MEEFFKTIQILFDRIPKKLQGLIALILLILMVVGCYFYFFPKEKSVENQCERISITGRIIDFKTKEPINAQQISLDNSTLDPDLTISQGVFTIKGVKLPKNKIVSFQIVLPNSKIHNTQDFNLNDEDKYPIENCVLDFGTIPINLPQKETTFEVKNQLKKNINLSEKTFSITNLVNENFITNLEKRLRLKYALNDGYYKISIGYSGDILPVNEDKTLFVYHGGNVIVKVNGHICGLVNDIKLERTFSSGNDFSFVEKEVKTQIYNQVNSNPNLIINEIESCLKK